MKYFLTRWIVLPTTVLFTIFSSTACLGNTSDTTEETALTTASTSTDTVVTDVRANYSQKDLNDSWDDSTSTHVTLNENSIIADQSRGLSINGSTVTITAAGTYVVSGKLTDGQIVVDAGDTDDVQIVLNNITLANSTASPIYVKQADKTIITLPADTVNAISDTSNYTFLEGEDEPDATIFSKSDLTLNGSGKLTVSANYRNGIASKDDLVITGGTIEVTAANDALRGRDSVSVKDGTLTLTAGGDGIKANQDADATKGWICLDGGSYTITAENDAIQAETILKINNGTYTIKTGGGNENAAAKTPSANEHMGIGHKNGGTPPTMDGTPPTRDNTPPEAGTTSPVKETISPQAVTQTIAITDTITQESYKGLKAGTKLIINNGTFSMNTNDDALHTNGNLTIAGGTFAISTGDDAIHADGDTLILDGTIQIDKSYEGIEGATVTIDGGNIKLTASDDGINAAGGSDGNVGMDSFRSSNNNWIRITGGNVTVDVAGDGIDANGTIYIDGGTTLINGPTSGGDSAVDFDESLIISGGTLVGAGAAGMTQSASSDSTQNSVMISYPQTQAAGTAVELTDASGNVTISFSPTKDYQSVLISTPTLTKGDTYTISSNSTKLSDIKLENTVTTVSSDGSTITNNIHQGGGRGSQRPENGQTKAAPYSEESSTAQ